jgi:hypothetical protein
VFECYVRVGGRYLRSDFTPFLLSSYPFICWVDWVRGQQMLQLDGVGSYGLARLQAQSDKPSATIKLNERRLGGCLDVYDTSVRRAHPATPCADSLSLDAIHIIDFAVFRCPLGFRPPAVEHHPDTFKLTTFRAYSQRWEPDMAREGPKT